MEIPGLETAIAMIIKFAITGTFLIVILYCTELFPTTLRWVYMHLFCFDMASNVSLPKKRKKEKQMTDFHE